MKSKMFASNKIRTILMKKERIEDKIEALKIFNELAEFIKYFS